jgi:hypothetical protein
MISKELPEIQAAALLWNKANAVGRDDRIFSQPVGFENIFTNRKLFLLLVRILYGGLNIRLNALPTLNWR